MGRGRDQTRFCGSLVGKLSLLLWLALTAGSLLGVIMLAADGAGWWSLTPLAIPAPASGLWARQFGAGLIMAYVGVPCLLTPAVVAVPFLLLYVIVEACGQQLGRSYRYLTSDAEAMEPI